jgi:hypothetical protein
MNLETYITESISTGKHHKQYVPESGCDIDEIIYWLKDMGVDNFIHYDGKYRRARLNSILVEIGPCKRSNKETIWVSVTHTTMYATNERWQTVIARPNYEYSSFQENGKTYHITFEQAIEMIRKIVVRPDKPVSL